MKTLLALPLLFLAGPAAAQDAPAAPASPSPQAAIEQACAKLPAVFRRAATRLQQPWECDLELGATSPSGALRGQGHALYYHARLFSLHLELDFEEAPGSASRSVLDVVADDASVYFEYHAGEDEAAFKVSLEALEEAAEALPAMLATHASSGPDGGGLDRFLASVAALDFRQDDEPDAHLARLRVDLRSLLPATEDAPERLDAAFEFDSRDGFPRALRLQAGGEGSLDLAVRALSFPDEIVESRCAYAGGPVVDLSGQLRMMIQAAGAAAEEEEF